MPQVGRHVQARIQKEDGQAHPNCVHKEFFDDRGTVTTAGIESNDATPAAEDAPLVARLRSAGAIVLGKTNVPRLVIAIETENPVYGRTSNPWDIVLAPAYTFVFNMLAMPAGVVPITTVQPAEESDRPATKDNVVRELLRAEEGSRDLPVGVQVVARLWR